MEDVSSFKSDYLEMRFFLARFKETFARLHKERFLLFTVILKTQTLALAYRQDLGDIILGLRPKKLITPGFFNSLRRLCQLLEQGNL